MYVNPFWFGVLITLVVEILALIVYAFLNFRIYEAEEDKEDENKT